VAIFNLTSSIASKRKRPVLMRSQRKRSVVIKSHLSEALH
jgi:hypothetical protein